MQTCPEGSFQNNARCIECSEECSTCSALGQCLACYETETDVESRVFVDGRCIDTCPVGTVQDDQEAICQRDEVSPNTNSTDPFTEQDGGDIWQFEIEECQVENCASCGIDSNYCQTCEEGMIMSYGECVPDCDNGFFKADDRCYKCNPVCKTCAGTANQCTSCFMEAEQFAIFAQTLFVPGHQMCALSCPAGTYLESESTGHCLDCSASCNTCSSEPGQCTSCLHDKDSGKDLFLLESQGTCVPSCPIFMEADLAMHRCVPPPSLMLRLKSWTSMLLLGSLIALVAGLLVSVISSRNTCSSIEVASSILSILESINRLCLFMVLWTSEAFLLFCTVGVCMLGSWLMALFFIETTFIPVSNAVATSQKSGQASSASQSLTCKIVRLLAVLSGVNTLRLLQSRFCGSERFNVDLISHSPCFYLKRLTQFNKASMALTAVWGLAGAIAVFRFGLAEDAAGMGLNAVILTVITLPVQYTLHKRDLLVSSQYRSVAEFDRD